MKLEWEFMDEVEGTYPFYKAYLNGKAIAMIVIRGDIYRLTMLWDDYIHKDFSTVWEAKNQFEVELVARRLEGKL